MSHHQTKRLYFNENICQYVTSSTIYNFPFSEHLRQWVIVDHSCFLKTVINDKQPLSSSCIIADINQCDSNPCNGHLCIDKVNAFKCQCKNGYYGDTCQNPPDYCKDSPCKNGATCSNSGNNFTCSCPRGYKGNQCQIQIGNSPSLYCWNRKTLEMDELEHCYRCTSSVFSFFNKLANFVLSGWRVECVELIFWMFSFLWSWSEISIPTVQ